VERLLTLTKLPTFANFIVTDCQLLSEFKLRRDNWLAVECSKDESVFIVAMIYLDPHPLRFAGAFIRKLDFYVIAWLIFGHCGSHKINFVATSQIIPGLACVGNQNFRCLMREGVSIKEMMQLIPPR